MAAHIIILKLEKTTSILPITLLSGNSTAVVLGKGLLLLELPNYISNHIKTMQLSIPTCTYLISTIMNITGSSREPESKQDVKYSLIVRG